MSEEYTEYDNGLEHEVRAFLAFLRWQQSLPYLVRIVMRCAIPHMPYYFSATSFIARNPSHHLAMVAKSEIEEATARKYGEYLG